MLEEKLLIWKFRCGSAEAFERIYVRHKDDLLKLAIVLLTDVHTAEDVVHDVFVHLARTRRDLRLVGHLRSLLATAVVNRARNARRDGKRLNARAEVKAEGAALYCPDPEQWAILSEQLRRLATAMALLPYEQREAITGTFDFPDSGPAIGPA